MDEKGDGGQSGPDPPQGSLDCVASNASLRVAKPGVTCDWDDSYVTHGCVPLGIEWSGSLPDQTKDKGGKPSLVHFFLWDKVLRLGSPKTDLQHWLSEHFLPSPIKPKAIRSQDGRTSVTFNLLPRFGALFLRRPSGESSSSPSWCDQFDAFCASVPSSLESAGATNIAVRRQPAAPLPDSSSSAQTSHDPRRFVTGFISGLDDFKISSAALQSFCSTVCSQYHISENLFNVTRVTRASGQVKFSCQPQLLSALRTIPGLGPSTVFHKYVLRADATFCFRCNSPTSDHVHGSCAAKRCFRCNSADHLGHQCKASLPSCKLCSDAGHHMGSPHPSWKCYRHLLEKQVFDPFSSTRVSPPRSSAPPAASVSGPYRDVALGAHTSAAVKLPSTSVVVPAAPSVAAVCDDLTSAAALIADCPAIPTADAVTLLGKVLHVLLALMSKLSPATTHCRCLPSTHLPLDQLSANPATQALAGSAAQPSAPARHVVSGRRPSRVPVPQSSTSSAPQSSAGSAPGHTSSGSALGKTSAGSALQSSDAAALPPSDAHSSGDVAPQLSDGSTSQSFAVAASQLVAGSAPQSLAGSASQSSGGAALQSSAGGAPQSSAVDAPQSSAGSASQSSAGAAPQSSAGSPSQSSSVAAPQASSDPDSPPAPAPVDPDDDIISDQLSSLAISSSHPVSSTSLQTDLVPTTVKRTSSRLHNK